MHQTQSPIGRTYIFTDQHKATVANLSKFPKDDRIKRKHYSYIPKIHYLTFLRRPVVLQKPNCITVFYRVPANCQTGIVVFYHHRYKVHRSIETRPRPREVSVVPATDSILQRKESDISKHDRVQAHARTHFRVSYWLFLEGSNYFNIFKCRNI